MIELLPMLSVFFPLIAAVVIYFLSRVSEKAGSYLAIGVSVVTFLMVFALYPAVIQQEVLSSSYKVFSLPLHINFRVDMLSFFLGLLMAFVWMIATIYSPGYMAREHAKGRYYSFLIMTLAASIGVVFAGDLLGLFLFFEMMAVLGYVLIIHEENSEAMFAGSKYLFMTIGAGLMVFFGMIVVYQLAGRIDFVPGGYFTETSSLSFAAFITFLLGFGVKAGMVPMHVWLPDAHPIAPSPVSALLSGVMIKVGAYGLIRIFYNVFGLDFIGEVGWGTILSVIAGVTMLLGSAVALREDDLKRRLAYSSIAQIGYILLGISLLTERAVTGALYHIFSHAFMKGCLFLCAGSIISQTKVRKISQLGGVGLKMPFTMLAFTLAVLSMIGIPPFNGFISKWYLALGALEVGQPVYVVLLIVSSLLNAAYYFPIVIAAFFGREAHEPVKELGKGYSEAPLSMVVSMAVLAVGCVAFALFPHNWPLELSRLAVKGILGL